MKGEEINAVGGSFGRCVAKDIFSFGLLRSVIAGVLVVAAVLKIVNPVRDIPGWFGFTIVVGELLLAAWLISGVFPHYCWYAATLCFSAFATVSAWKIAVGETDCGCFGVIRTPPKVAFGIDMAAIGLLVHCIRVSTFPKHQRVLTRVTIACFFGVGAALISLLGPSLLRGVDDAGFSVHRDFTALVPEKWIGRKLPIADYIDVTTDISHGSWELVLYDHNCEECQQLIQRVGHDGSHTGQLQDGTRLALIEIPPYGNSRPLPRSKSCVVGRLTDKINWFVQTPVQLRIDDLQVVSVRGTH